MSAIQSDYRTFRHIPSRKCYQLIMEIPEEEFASVCNVLGYPKTGENTYVAIALLNKTVVKESFTGESKEGDKLRIRAVMLCKEKGFQEYMNTVVPSSVKGLPSETEVCWWIRSQCNIKSRSELATNLDAQIKFRELDRKFKDWQFAQNHIGNIERI